jgi:hypothetical protein
VVFASVVAPLQIADAAPKPPKIGSACTKVGIFFDTPNMRYVCNKEGAKLVWRTWNPPKPKSASSPAPVSSSSPTPTPTQSAAPAPKPTATPTKPPFKAKIPIQLPVAPMGPITFANVMDHISEIPALAYQNVQSVIAANAPVKVPTTVYVGPTTVPDQVGGVARIQEILDREAQLWGGFSQPTFYRMYIYNATDVKTTEDRFTADFKSAGYSLSDQEFLSGPLRALAGNCQQGVIPGQFTGPVTSCGGANSGSYYNSDDSFLQLGASESGAQDFYRRDGGVVGHEYLHAVQTSQFIGVPNCTAPGGVWGSCSHSSMANQGFSPCWIFEGMPNSIGPMVSSRLLADYLTYHKQLPFNQGPTTVTDYSQSSLQNYLFNQSAPSCYRDMPTYRQGYAVGALATEVLVAIAGPQSTMALFALAAEGQDFQRAFQSVYGMSWVDASLIISKVLAAEYLTYGPAPK